MFGPTLIHLFRALGIFFCLRSKNEHILCRLFCARARGSHKHKKPCPAIAAVRAPRRSTTTAGNAPPKNQTTTTWAVEAEMPSSGRWRRGWPSSSPSSSPRSRRRRLASTTATPPGGPAVLPASSACGGATRPTSWRIWSSSPPSTFGPMAACEWSLVWSFLLRVYLHSGNFGPLSAPQRTQCMQSPDTVSARGL